MPPVTEQAPTFKITIENAPIRSFYQLSLSLHDAEFRVGGAVNKIEVIDSAEFDPVKQPTSVKPNLIAEARDFSKCGIKGVFEDRVCLTDF